MSDTTTSMMIVASMTGARSSQLCRTWMVSVVMETTTGVTGIEVVITPLSSTNSILIAHVIGVGIAGDGVGSSSFFDGSCPAVGKFETPSRF